MDSADQTPKDLDSAAHEEPRWQWSAWARAGCFFAGVILPVICMVLAKDFSREWQSSATSDYAMLLLSRQPARAFCPFFLYSMASMTLLVISPNRYSKVFLVRLGIYTGVLLAVQYFCIVAMAIPDFAIVATILVLALWGSAGRIPLRPVENAAEPGLGTIIVFIVALNVAVIVIPLNFVLFLASPAYAVPWAILAYSAMARRLIRHRPAGPWQFSLAQLLGVTAWFAAWFGAWRISIG